MDAFTVSRALSLMARALDRTLSESERAERQAEIWSMLKSIATD